MIGCIFGKEYECKFFEKDVIDCSNGTPFLGVYKIHYRIIFDNNYGASIINNGIGSKEGLLELALLKCRCGELIGLWEGKTKIEKELGIDDVIGNLTHEEVFKWLDKIRNFKEGVL